MTLFDALGFSWDRLALPSDMPKSMERAVFRYKQALVQFVYDASALEGNPFTYPEVKTLMDGVTVGGHRLSDERQVLNLAAAAGELFAMVRSRQFRMDKATFNRLHGLVAREEALEWGHFRGEGKETQLTPDVHLGEKGAHQPFPTLPGAPQLNAVFSEGAGVLASEVPDARERSMAFFLFGALQQFYFDGNKRTSRFMMNGILMSSGYDAISVPAARALEFNERMVSFYLERDATEMMGFLIQCQPRDAPRPSPLQRTRAIMHPSP